MPEKELLVAAALAGYPPELGAALWRLEDARARTVRELGNVSDDDVDRESGGNSIGTILYHVALIEADWLFTEILQRPIPPDVAALLPADDRDRAGVLTAVRGQSLAQHVERLAHVRQTLLRELQDLSAEEFHRPRDLPSYRVSPAWVLHHLAQHEAEHRGEIGSVVTAVRG